MNLHNASKDVTLSHLPCVRARMSLGIAFRELQLFHENGNCFPKTWCFKIIIVNAMKLRTLGCTLLGPHHRPEPVPNGHGPKK